jgi:hypothetical protein
MPSNDDKLERAAHAPFIAANVKVEFRIANALEYIAAQLGEINSKLDRFNVPSTKESLQNQVDLLHKL